MFKSLIIILILATQSMSSFANDRCSEERKQCVEFYKYELEFIECEKERNEATKTFDLKWEKPKFYRAVFR